MRPTEVVKTGRTAATAAIATILGAKPGGPCQAYDSEKGRPYALISWDEMPTVLRAGPYRLFFYAGDRDEPEHVHVERAGNVAKFWLDPVRLERSVGFDRRELTVIERIVKEHQQELVGAWHDYFQG